jgi:hypothetical protein
MLYPFLHGYKKAYENLLEMSSNTKHCVCLSKLSGRAHAKLSALPRSQGVIHGEVGWPGYHGCQLVGFLASIKDFFHKTLVMNSTHLISVRVDKTETALEHLQWQ